MPSPHLALALALLLACAAGADASAACSELRARQRLPAATACILIPGDLNDDSRALISIRKDTIVFGGGRYPVYTGRITVSHGATAVVSGVHMRSKAGTTGSAITVAYAELRVEDCTIDWYRASFVRPRHRAWQLLQPCRCT